MVEIAKHELTPKIAELLRKMKQTANRSLRKTYANQAKTLLQRAEESSDPHNIEEQAGIRKLRNDLIVTLDTQFPISQRKADTKALGSSDDREPLTCSFGIVEGDTTINQMPKWYVLVGLAILFFSLGRTTKKVYRRMRRK
tara:strand:+ start:204 stop:626 length:423 start_codon:yes stop_codon:yes gene_type:complete